MNKIGSALAKSSDRILMLMEALPQGIEPDRFRRFPLGPDGPVHTNHPAFVYGHLSLYAARIAELVGQDPAGYEAPADWQQRFDKGVQCLDDADGTHYPMTRQTLTETCLNSYRKVVDVLAQTSDEALLRPTTLEALKNTFPTTLTAVIFLLDAHAMYHLGQISTWRRIDGLGPATNL